jgi:hypothetical protein
MESIDTTDAAIGWGLIGVAALLCYFGSGFVTRFLVREIGASLAQRRRERERIQDELDERLRQELLEIVANERRDG